MEDESVQFLDAQHVLDAFPFLAMIINEDYEVVIANTWFAKNIDEQVESCPFTCYEATVGTACHEAARDADGPRPDCPLAESIRTGAPVERELAVGVGYALQVAIHPLRITDSQGKKLFLDLAKPICDADASGER